MLVFALAGSIDLLLSLLILLPLVQNFEERITVEGIESGPGFSVVGKIVGRGGNYLRYISDLSRSKVFLKGKGSNFQEDQDCPLHLHIMCRSSEDMAKAKELCTALLDTVRKQYEDWKFVCSFLDSFGVVHVFPPVVVAPSRVPTIAGLDHI